MKKNNKETQEPEGILLVCGNEYLKFGKDLISGFNLEEGEVMTFGKKRPIADSIYVSAYDGEGEYFAWAYTHSQFAAKLNPERTVYLDKTPVPDILHIIHEGMEILKKQNSQLSLGYLTARIEKNGEVGLESDGICTTATRQQVQEFIDQYVDITGVGFTR
jgi:hypothetical protein